MLGSVAGGTRSVSSRPVGRTTKKRNCRVLVAEDAPGILAALTAILESSGYDVVTARDGLDAWREFERNAPDLVILDLDLPTISGFRLMHLFRGTQAAPQVPVVVVTGYDYEEAQDVVRAGASDLVTKPFDARDLLDRVECALQRAKGGMRLQDRATAAIA